MTIELQIVKQCKGFPLAITMVGRSLCGQPVEMWHKRSRGSILESETELFLSLKRSSDDLDTCLNSLKECFIDLSSFPEDKKIYVAALVDMWVELYDDLDDEILCIANIHELTARSLAKLISPRYACFYDSFCMYILEMLHTLRVYVWTIGGLLKVRWLIN